MVRAVTLFAAVSLFAAARGAAAQEFVPPDRGARQPAQPQPSAPPPAQQPAPAAARPGGINVGVFGFTTRGGMQVNRGSQGVIGSTADIVTLGTPLVRLRPSFEMGFGSGVRSIGLNLEAVYRFQPDQAPAIPYLGLGVGYYDDSTATRVWPTVVMGFELSFSRSVNWLVEYHALDGLRRSRFFVGLASRGAN